MSDRARWLADLDGLALSPLVDGLVAVEGYSNENRPPEEVALMEKAKSYGANYVFFEAPRNGRPAVAQAFVYVCSAPADDESFAELHKRLWSWGGVPLVYRCTPGLVQLFRCGHKADFISATGEMVCWPIKSLTLATTVASQDAWWDAARLRNGTLWDDPDVCHVMLSARQAAPKLLITAVRQLNEELNSEGILKRHLRRKLLILSLLIAYLEERGVFLPDYFGQFVSGATKFFQVLANGKALVKLLDDLEDRFNGHVFTLEDADREALRTSGQLQKFANLVEGHEAPGGQLTLWRLYSFRDLPVELISHIYQLFVHDSDTAVYTPPFLVRLMLQEALSWERLDRLQARDEIILDPACGSGVFLVEAYKRLVLHWRSRNDWKRPRTNDLKRLLKKVHGIDSEQGAIELAAFSLCLALCDALEPEEIRASIKLFPQLAGRTLHWSCFFEAKETGLIREPIGALVGNPPFASKISTPGATRSYERYIEKHGALPDKQVSYLFLHEAMDLLAGGGVLSMLQQYGFLYNQQTAGFRQRFIETWDVREILDFISVRGLFKKGEADTKVVVVVANRAPPKVGRKILHAVFRRTGRVEAEQSFDIDYYDLHWLPRELALTNDRVWRADLFGGGRVLAYVDRLSQYQTLQSLASERGWDFGEGFIEGKSGSRVPAPHITGKKYLPSEALLKDGPDREQITTAKGKLFRSPYKSGRFTPPMLLVRAHQDLDHCAWTESYLTYSQRIIGFCAPEGDTHKIRAIDRWLKTSRPAVQAYVALISPGLFVQKATALQADDIFSIPYPKGGDLDLSENEEILIRDVVTCYSDLIRLGDRSEAMRRTAEHAVPAFAETFTRQVNAIYKKRPLRALTRYTWPGVVCQPFVFGKGVVDWAGAEQLRGKLDALLRQQQGASLWVNRIVRLYEGSFVFLVKPNRLRFWLRSIALRDADEMLADLRAQGF